MSISEISADLARHAGFGDKYSGGPGDLATAEWIAGALSEAGYSVAQQRISLPVNRVDELSLSGVACALFAQPNLISGVITAPIHVIHDRVQAPMARNAIAVLAAPYGRHSTIWMQPIAGLIEAACDAGARAIIVLPTGPTGDILGLNTWADRPFAGVPLVIGRPSELPLYLAQEGMEATLTVRGRIDRVETPNIIATRKAGARWIAISTPRTGFFTCLTERGSGTAAFLHMARRLPELYPDHSLFLMNTTGHELAFAGTHAAMRLAPSPAETDVWVHLGATLAANDHQETRIGRMVRCADPNRILMATSPMRAACADAFRGLSGLEDPREVIKGAGELSAITDLGYSHAFTTLGQSRWFHTPQDTLDKLDPALLLPVVEAHLAALDAGIRSHHR
jgi:hypothetical protein